MSGDPYYNYTSLLLPFTGANDSTIFADASPNPKTITRYGDTKISTAQSAWADGCGYFDGAGDYLTVPADAAFVMGSGDFTIELWFKTTQAGRSNATLVARGTPGFWGGSWAIMSDGDGANQRPSVFLADYYRSGALLVSSATGYNDGNPHHLAWVRFGNVHTLYLDGVARATNTTAAVMVDSGTPLVVGTDLNWTPRNYLGYQKDLRITKGVARYTGNFTPSAAPFPTYADLACNAFLMEPGGPLTCAPAALSGPPQGFLLAEPNRAFDVEDGGRAVVEGIVTLNGVPGGRKVRLHTLNNGRLIREVWSDPVTGAYRFDHLKDQPYYVWSEDYARIYDPVSHLVANSPG